MPPPLLAHVQVTDTARFDVEQKVLAGVPLTQADAELLLAIAQQTTEEAMAALADGESSAEALEEEMTRADAAEAKLAELSRVVKDITKAGGVGVAVNDITAILADVITQKGG